jgi:hypothetical protein
MTAGARSLSIIDEVTNLSDEPGELQLLYHTNVGPPLLEEGAELVAAASEVAPYDLHSVRGVDDWAGFQGPTPGWSQHCYFLELIPDESFRSKVLLQNRARDEGMGLSFDTRELPHFTVWKNLQGKGDGYVVGLEPGTCFPNLKTFERERNRVIALPPGGAYRTSVEIEVYHGQEEVEVAAQAIQRLAKQQATLIRHIDTRYSPADAMKV